MGEHTVVIDAPAACAPCMETMEVAASELTIADDGRLEALLRLRSKVEGLADAFAEVISMTESLAEEDGTAAALLRESLGLVESAPHTLRSASAQRARRDALRTPQMCQADLESISPNRPHLKR